jgi:hypothetical protein
MKAEQSAILVTKLEGYHRWALTEPRIGGCCINEGGWGILHAAALLYIGNSCVMASQ